MTAHHRSAIVLIVALTVTPACIVPGSHMQHFYVWNDADEDASFGWSLWEVDPDGNPWRPAQNDSMELHNRSWGRDYARLGNGRYEFKVSMMTKSVTVKETLAGLAFGDSSASNPNPEHDPRILLTWWDGARLRVVACTEDCPQRPDNLTKEVEWQAPDSP